jgi:predicted alpha/beta hydrolase family esterase
MTSRTPTLRLLVVPGLNDSGPAHWQSWLEAGERDAARVIQRDWATPELDRWADRIADTIDETIASPDDDADWVVAAHSFGCLALARYLARGGRHVGAALFVAPADPAKFSVGALLPAAPLQIPSALVASDTDPWMAASTAQAWAVRWGSAFSNIGDAGHINVASGYGPLPLAKALLERLRAKAARKREAVASEPQGVEP